MPRLIVKNVGPIKDVDLDLKKVNVLMGPQGSGKSTLAKIISFCSWMEKDNDRTLDVVTKGMVHTLSGYHRMDGYFAEDSQLAYIGENVAFFCQYPEPLPLNWKQDEYNTMHIHEQEVFFSRVQKSVNPKVSYIRAERNFVSVVPNLRKYAEKDDSLQGFVNDWFAAKRHYTKQNPLHIDVLDVDYYYNEKTDSDMVIDHGELMQLNQTSSGFQSVIPLVVMATWLTSGIYQENKPFSPEETQRMQDILSQITSDSSTDMEKQVIERMRGFMQGKVFTHTQLIVEEPEQNLFPDTQLQLLYFLLRSINHGRPHRLVLTTHSPYILSTLNVLLRLAKAFEYASDDQRKRLEPIASELNVAVHPSDLAAYFITNDGQLQDVIDEELCMVSGVELDVVSDWVDEKISQIRSVIS